MEPLTDDDIDRLINLTSVSPGAALVHRAVNEIDRLRQQLADVTAKAQQMDADWIDDARAMEGAEEIIERLSGELADVTAQRDELENGQGHTQARDVLRDIVHQMGIETADPESGVEMTAYELACAVGGSLVGLRGIRDQLRAELQMSEARREKELSDSARTLQELQGIVEKLRSQREPDGVDESYRSIIREWVGTPSTLGKYESVHPETVRNMLATITDPVQLEWCRWLVWWHGFHCQQLETRSDMLQEEQTARQEAEQERDRLRAEPLRAGNLLEECLPHEGIQDEYAAVLEAVAATKGNP